MAGPGKELSANGADQAAFIRRDTRKRWLYVLPPVFVTFSSLILIVPIAAWVQLQGSPQH